MHCLLQSCARHIDRVVKHDIARYRLSPYIALYRAILKTHIGRLNTIYRVIGRYIVLWSEIISCVNVFYRVLSSSRPNWGPRRVVTWWTWACRWLGYSNCSVLYLRGRGVEGLGNIHLNLVHLNLGRGRGVTYSAKQCRDLVHTTTTAKGM